MTISCEVKNRIDALNPGDVFSYQKLNLPACFSEAVIKALNRMVIKGDLVKLSPGKFYKPQESVKPTQEQILKDLLEKDGKPIGYITGYFLFNQYALTTQLPDAIQIGRRGIKKKVQRGIYTVTFVQQPNEITGDNIPLLQLLDVIRMIKEIPGAEINESCKRLMLLLQDLSEKELNSLIGLAQNYSPATRAFTGAMIERLWGRERVRPLYESLNVLTTYRLGIDEAVLPQKKKWGIK